MSSALYCLTRNGILSNLAQKFNDFMNYDSNTHKYGLTVTLIQIPAADTNTYTKEEILTLTLLKQQK